MASGTVPSVTLHPVDALMYQYARLIDAGDFDGVGNLFAAGAVALADGTVIAEGAEAVTALYEATTLRHADGTPRTRHLVTNQVIDIDEGGGTARATSDFLVVQLADGGEPLTVVAAGRYDDRFVRDGGRWRFAERRMSPQLFGDVSRHLRFR